MCHLSKSKRVLSTTVLSAGFAGTAIAQQGGLDCAFGQNLGFHELSNIPRSVAIDGSSLYFGNDAGIIAFDMTDPNNPVELSSLANSSVRLMTPIGDELYISTGLGGATLGIVDISNPASISMISTFAIPGLDQILSIARSGNTLYVGTWNGNIVVLDVSNLLSPSLVTTLNLGSGVRVTVDGDRLFACWNGGGTSVFDITDPSNPTFVSNFGVTDANRVVIDGSNAFVLDQDYGFRVYDVSDLGAVIEIADVELEAPHPFWVHNTYNHALIGDKYYIQDFGMSGLRTYVYDVQDPGSPSKSGDFESPYGYAGEISRTGAFGENFAVLTNVAPERGFEVFGVDKAYLNPGGETIYTNGVINADGYLFRNRESGIPARHSIDTYDISNPQNPVVIGQFNAQYLATGALYLYGDYLLRVQGGQEVQVIDASNPVSLTQVASIPIGDGLPFQGGSITIGDQDLVATWRTEFGLIQFADFSDPTSPAYIGEYDFGSGDANQIKNVEIHNGLAFVALGSREIALLDLSNTSNPFEVGRVIDPQIASHNIALDSTDSFLYVGTGGLVLVYSLADPSSPLLVGTYDFGSGGSASQSNFRVQGEHLFMSNPRGPGSTMPNYDRLPYFVALDISDPTMISVAGGYTPPFLPFPIAQHINGMMYLSKSNYTIPVSLEFGCETCVADLNGDGVLDFFDVSAFLNAYNSADPQADLNGDGILNFFDVSAFLNEYNNGCP